MRPWTLRRRVTVLLAFVAALLVAAVSFITFAAFTARDSLDRQVDELSPAQAAVQQVMSAYLNMDNGLRGYALTGNEDFLSPYQQGRNTVRENEATLESVAGDNEEIQAAVNDVLAAGEAWDRDFAEPTLAKVRAGEEVDTEAFSLGRERFGQLREAAETAEERIDDEISQARTGLSYATQQVVALLVLVGFVVVMLAVFLWVMLQHWVLRPLDELAGHLQQVSEGYYAHRIELHGPPEITRVGRDVDAMRERIVSDLHEVGAARRKLQEQSELLEHQADELRRSNMELEQFAYVASHDLQEPLRKVASFCQLLQRRYKGQLDERADSYIDFAVEGAKRMQTLINDLLAFSRVGRTKNFAPVDLNQALEDALNSLETRLDEAGAVVTGQDLPTVEGDRTLLTQVFFNLVGNAVKFRGENDARVDVSVRREGDEWVFCCADNGIGIDPQYAERIFVIFQRLHTRDKYGGTGIGLAMCKKIIEFHGGRIWLATGDEEPGTRICWSLPAVPEQSRAQDGPAAGAGQDGDPQDAEDPAQAAEAEAAPEDPGTQASEEEDRPDGRASRIRAGGGEPPAGDGPDGPPSRGGGSEDGDGGGPAAEGAPSPAGDRRDGDEV
ncbi:MULTISPECIES: sensor histidine kinase [Nocardiopsis]|uniref:sensor histidine kinase n=1 Tax=Nocardiopsis TaxID=2013 RepID=UPI0003493BDC|nr:MULTISPECIES: sensor histidine kinase [Nocardiopsis]